MSKIFSLTLSILVGKELYLIYIIVEKLCHLLMHDQISQISQLNRVVKGGHLKVVPLS